MNHILQDQEITILLVDDKSGNLGPLVKTLEACGYEIMVARDGEKGLMLAEHVRPNLILLDAIMPKMDGFETCRQLKAQSATKDIPVIFMTALDKPQDKVKGFEVGAVDYVTKPIQIDEILARVSAHLQIRKLQTQLQQQNTLLEEKNTVLLKEVTEREKAEANLRVAHNNLEKTLDHLQQTQAQLIESEKMAALGKLVANIAHEINTPIGAIHSSIGNISYAVEQILTQLPTFFLSLSAEERKQFFALLHRALKESVPLSIREENKAQRMLLKRLEKQGFHCTPHLVEMLANIGIHKEIQEIFPLLRNPKHVEIVNMVYQLAGLRDSTQTITKAIQRVSKIIFALKTYTQPQDPSGEMVKTDLLQNIETTLMLSEHQLKHGIEVIRKYENIPSILCYPDELQQVWINLIQNAVQAMNYQGTLTIACKTQEHNAVVEIIDTGDGIKDELKEKIFDPFFTTRSTGEGSGLGLNIAKRIIEKHRGHIEVESHPEETTFRIFLPLQ